MPKRAAAPPVIKLKQPRLIGPQARLVCVESNVKRFPPAAAAQFFTLASNPLAAAFPTTGSVEGVVIEVLKSRLLRPSGTDSD